MSDKIQLNNLRAILKEKGITQQKFADMIGSSYVSVNCIINNRKQPSLHKLFEIASILGVKPTKLINDDALVNPSRKG